MYPLSPISDIIKHSQPIEFDYALEKWMNSALVFHRTLIVLRVTGRHYCRNKHCWNFISHEKSSKLIFKSKEIFLDGLFPKIMFHFTWIISIFLYSCIFSKWESDIWINIIFDWNIFFVVFNPKTKF